LIEAFGSSLRDARDEEAELARGALERRRSARASGEYLREKTKGMLADAVKALRSILDIALDETAKPRDRIMAAEKVWDRLVGRRPIWQEETDDQRSPVLVALNQTFGPDKINQLTRTSSLRTPAREAGNGSVGEALEGPVHGDCDSEVA